MAASLIEKVGVEICVSENLRQGDQASAEMMSESLWSMLEICL